MDASTKGYAMSHEHKVLPEKIKEYLRARKDEGYTIAGLEQVKMPPPFTR